LIVPQIKQLDAAIVANVGDLTGYQSAVGPRSIRTLRALAK
jgi:hypothetical protein